MHQINESQRKMLGGLREQIAEKWSIGIGYTSPMGSFIDENDEFIIFDNNCDELDDAEMYLVYKDDMNRIDAGIMCCDKMNEFVVHDDKVMAFLSRVLTALESGELSTPRKITREIDGITVVIEQLSEKVISASVDSGCCIHSFNTGLSDLAERICDAIGDAKIAPKFHEVLCNYSSNRRDDIYDVLMEGKAIAATYKHQIDELIQELEAEYE